MTSSKNFLRLIVCSGIALLFWALASRVINAETVTFSLSPINGIHVKAEGSHQ